MIKVETPNGEEQIFYMRNCLDSHMTEAELLSGEENCSQLTLDCVTGDLLNAGTGGSVYVCLFDSTGNSSGIRCLRCSDTRNMFQRKQTDTFQIFCNPPMGNITSLNVLLEPKVQCTVIKIEYYYVYVTHFGD